VLEFVSNNLEAILAAILGLKLLAQAVVNATHTPADDAAVAKFYRVIEVVAGIWSPRAKELPGEKLDQPKLPF
jgi:hypothetical protein